MFLVDVFQCIFCFIRNLIFVCGKGYFMYNILQNSFSPLMDAFSETKNDNEILQSDVLPSPSPPPSPSPSFSQSNSNVLSSHSYLSVCPTTMEQDDILMLKLESNTIKEVSRSGDDKYKEDIMQNSPLNLCDRVSLVNGKKLVNCVKWFVVFSVIIFLFI
jgi:hypothetical protein